MRGGGFWTREVGACQSYMHWFITYFSLCFFYVSLHTCYTSDSLCFRVMMEYRSCLKGGGWAGFIRILAFIIYYFFPPLLLLRVQLVGASFWSVFLFGIEEFFIYLRLVFFL